MSKYISDSILDSVKSSLGIVEGYPYFDSQLIQDINGVFSKLHQLGVGPDDGFEIDGPEDMWADYLNDEKRLNLVKTYMNRNIRLLFDPPSNSFAVETVKESIKELEWRINVMVESGDL